MCSYKYWYSVILKKTLSPDSSPVNMQHSSYKLVFFNQSGKQCVSDGFVQLIRIQRGFFVVVFKR